MKDLNEMRRFLTAKVEAAREILDTAQAESRSLTKAEMVDYDRRMVEIQEDRAELAREELRRETEPDGPLEILDDILGAEGLTTRAGIRPGRDYRSLFGEPKRQTTFRGLADFMAAVADPRDPRLRASEARAMSEGIPADGGFLVPDEFSSEFINMALEQSVMLSRSTVWPLKSGTIKAPGWDGSNHATSLFGGLTGTWLSEAGTATPQTPKTRMIELSAKKLGIYVDVSSEWLSDAVLGEQRLREAMSAAVTFYLDDAFINGTGAGQPLGLLNSPCLVTVAKETGQAADSIVYENIVNMWSRMLPACQVKALWIAHPDTVPSFFTMGITLGMGGAPVFLPAGGASGSPYSTLFGRPIVFSEKCQTVGTEGDIVLTDPTMYAAGLRGDVRLESTNARQWYTDQVSFRCIVRADGESMLDTAVTPKNGTATLSSVVTLADRA